MCAYTDSKSVSIVESKILGYPTLRHARCELLVGPGTPRCREREDHRKSLHSIVAKQSTDPVQILQIPAVTPTIVTWHPPSELRDRLHHLHTQFRLTTKQLNVLKKRIEAACEEEAGVLVDDDTHDDLKSIMEANDSNVTSLNSADSFLRIFWDQQKQAAAVKNAKHMRWHPKMIKWCLYHRHLSSSAYDLVRSSGCLNLPLQRTLRDYTYTSKTTVGFSTDIDASSEDNILF